jgi:hypothetical protein
MVVHHHQDVMLLFFQTVNLQVGINIMNMPQKNLHEAISYSIQLEQLAKHKQTDPREYYVPLYRLIIPYVY